MFGLSGTSSLDTATEGETKAETSAEKEPSTTVVEQDASTKSARSNRDASLKSLDEDQLFVELPAPGFRVASATMLTNQAKHRMVSNLCSICLCNYNVGDTVVWSSNEACEQ